MFLLWFRCQFRMDIDIHHRLLNFFDGRLHCAAGSSSLFSTFDWFLSNQCCWIFREERGGSQNISFLNRCPNPDKRDFFLHPFGGARPIKGGLLWLIPVKVAELWLMTLAISAIRLLKQFLARTVEQLMLEPTMFASRNLPQ